MQCAALAWQATHDACRVQGHPVDTDAAAKFASDTGLDMRKLVVDGADGTPSLNAHYAM